MILLPSKGRRESVERYITHCCLTNTKERHVLIIESGDDSYEDISVPHPWIIRKYIGGQGAASHFNKIFSEFPDERYYAYVADDCIPRTEGWDQILLGECLKNHFAYPNDGERGEAFAPHAFVSGDLVRMVGELNPLGLHHYGFDNYWFNLARSIGAIKYCPEVLLEHAHPRMGKAKMDSTYKQDAEMVIPRPNPDSDKWRLYKKSKEFDELKATIKGKINA